MFYRLLTATALLPGLRLPAYSKISTVAKSRPDGHDDAHLRCVLLRGPGGPRSKTLPVRSITSQSLKAAKRGSRHCNPTCSIIRVVLKGLQLLLTMVNRFLPGFLEQSGLKIVSRRIEYSYLAQTRLRSPTIENYLGFSLTVKTGNYITRNILFYPIEWSEELL